MDELKLYIRGRLIGATSDEMQLPHSTPSWSDLVRPSLGKPEWRRANSWMVVPSTTMTKERTRQEYSDEIRWRV
jgi:hypothetical protein